MKLKFTTFAIQLALASALASISAVGSAASFCDANGKPAERVLVNQKSGQFELVWQPGRAGPGLRSDPILGEFNAASGLRIGPQGFPVAASYMGPNQRLGVALWFHGQKTVQLRGLMTKVAFSPARDSGVFVAYVEDPRDEQPEVEVQAVYSRDGRKLAERTLPADREAYSGETFSVKGDVLFVRPAPGMSSMRSVTLYDSGNFEEVMTFDFGGELIDDVVVVDRHTAFFTARTGVYRVHGGRIESIGEPGAPMQNQRLDIDSVRGRLLSRGPGGHQVFSLDGRALAGHFHGGRHFSIEGFADDGTIIDAGVYNRIPYRLLDPLTSEVLAELPPGRMHPANRPGERTDCISVDGIVLRNDQGPSTTVPLQRTR